MTQEGETGMTVPNRHRTAAIQKSIETGERHPLHYFDSRRYVQHNLALGDGLGPLLEFLDSLPPGTSKVRPLRLFEDGDVSFAHLEYFLEPMGGAVVGFEVHRWENGHIVEHWDNLQALPGTSNPSGRTMVDGPTDVSDLERTGSNKRHCEEFVRRVLIGGDTDAFLDYLAEDLRQHDPDTADGAGQLLAKLAASNDGPSYSTLHHLFGEGNFCLCICEGLTGGRPCAVYDLFRLHDDLIVEHWNVREPIPPRADWKNDNGKF